MVTLHQARDDAEARNRFIEQNKKFILGCAYKAVKHYVTESDDEWSVALIAFNEAIDSFDEERSSFEGFASLVIKRRLVDYIRSGKKYIREVSTEPYVIDGDLDDEEDPSAFQMEVRKKSAEMTSDALGTITVKDEIEAMQQVLSDYGFSFYDLADCSPKADKTKKSCSLVVSALLNEESLFSRMRSGKTLPIKELSEKSEVPRKILDRHRRYIIAAAEILHGDYPLLSEYLGYIKRTL